MTNRVKVVLAAPGSADPPDNPLWTTDNMEGINPPEFEGHQLPTPYDYGAIGDGIADDTVAIQAWLDAIAGGVGYGKAGTFILSAPVAISSDTTIWGGGKGQFILKSKQGVPQDFHIFWNKNFLPDPAVDPVDKNIAIYGTQFCGQSTGDDAIHDFVDLCGVNGLIIRDCLFQHRRRDLLLLANVRNGVVDSCEFVDWGGGPPDTPGAGQWAGGMAIFAQRACYDLTVTNNHIHDGQGGGIWMPVINTLSADPNPLRGICSNNTVVSVGEVGIVLGPIDCTCEGNIIQNVSLVDVSGHGIEAHGDNIVINGNDIQLCAATCISFSNPTNATITNNVLDLPSQAYTGVPPHDVRNPALSILAQLNSSSGEGAPPFENITITGNTMSSGDGKGLCPIKFDNGNGATYVFKSVQCYNNNFGQALSTRWGGYPDLVQFDPSFAAVAGDQFVWGHSMQIPYVLDFSINSGASGTVTKTGVPFRPTRVEFNAVANSTTAVQCSTGHADIAGPNSCISWSADGTHQQSNIGSSNYCIWILNPDSGGTDILKAAIVTAAGMTDDGFVLTITGTSTATVQVSAVCYP